ncbi:hypothetical protein KI387_003254, partial [Taxus chinensis]
CIIHTKYELTQMLDSLLGVELLHRPYRVQYNTIVGAHGSTSTGPIPATGLGSGGIGSSGSGGSR